MKSVSFSDLRESSKMNNSDSNIKRSSSNKQLTYYSSSEDILRRFSTKTSEKILPKETRKFEENKPEILNPVIEPIVQEIEEYKPEYQTSTSDKTIKELRDQVKQKNNMIANLQDENLLLKNESTKNSEQVKFLENRIKYLEHVLDAFNAKSEERIQDQKIGNGKIDKENQENLSRNEPIYVKSKPFNSRVNFEINTSIDDVKSSNYGFDRNRTRNDNINQEKNTDLRKRPNSADSMLQNNYPVSTCMFEEDSQNQNRNSSMKFYDSDSDQNHSNNKANITTNDESAKSSPANYINFQRQKLERDRTMNLSEFKSRLDDFTKYARKSAEQNSLRSSSSSLPLSNEYKPISKQPVIPDKWSDSLIKNRVKSSSNYSRPPIDPYYKQRKVNIPETKPSNELLMNYSSISQNSPDEDLVLKDRVKKILEKHNYPINNTYYSNNSNNISNNGPEMSYYENDFTNPNSYKVSRNNDNIRASDWRQPNLSTQYGISSNSKTTFNDSNIPRLDLNLNNQFPFHSDDTSDLLEKYLNYQGYANVS